MRLIKFILFFVVPLFVALVRYWYDAKPSCTRRDQVKYCLVKNTVHTGWLRAQTGTDVGIYDITDIVSWIRFRYRLYYTEQPYTQIQDQVYHVYPDIYSGVALYAAEGWRFMTTIHYTGGIDNEWLQDFLRALHSGNNTTGCVLTGNMYFDQQYARFAQSRYKVRARDIAIGDQALLSCPFVVSPVRMPVFIVDSNRPGTILVVMLPADIAGVMDMDRVDSLVR